MRLPLARISVAVDVAKIHPRRDSRRSVQFAPPAPEVGVVRDAAPLAAEVNGVEADQQGRPWRWSRFSRPGWPRWSRFPKTGETH